MPTIKQRKAFKQIIENHSSISKAMRDVGYKKTTATVPYNLTKSKGWQELCEEIGLTDELLATALVEDIKAKPQNRKAELELGFKVKGRLKENETPTQQNNFFILDDDRASKIARRILGRTATDNQSS